MANTFYTRILKDINADYNASRFYEYDYRKKFPLWYLDKILHRTNDDTVIFDTGNKHIEVICTNERTKEIYLICCTFIDKTILPDKYLLNVISNSTKLCDIICVDSAEKHYDNILHSNLVAQLKQAISDEYTIMYMYITTAQIPDNLRALANSDTNNIMPITLLDKNDLDGQYAGPAIDDGIPSKPTYTHNEYKNGMFIGVRIRSQINYFRMLAAALFLSAITYLISAIQNSEINQLSVLILMLFNFASLFSNSSATLRNKISPNKIKFQYGSKLKYLSQKGRTFIIYGQAVLVALYFFMIFLSDELLEYPFLDNRILWYSLAFLTLLNCLWQLMQSKQKSDELRAKMQGINNKNEIDISMPDSDRGKRRRGQRPNTTGDNGVDEVLELDDNADLDEIASMEEELDLADFNSETYNDANTH